MKTIVNTPIALPKLPTDMILVVEHQEAMRNYICTCLQHHFHVVATDTGDHAWALAIEHLPNLVISNTTMPGLNGLALCQRLKNDERTHHIPMIMLTSEVNVEAKIEGLDHGADDCLVKPFFVPELQARIRNLIQVRKRLNQKFEIQRTFKPKEVAVSSQTDRFIKKVMNIVETNIRNDQFGLDLFANEAGMSTAQLYRKLKAATGYKPNDFIRHVRLQRAAELLQKKFGNVADAAYHSGFNNLSYFSKCFKAEFKCSPSAYVKD